MNVKIPFHVPYYRSVNIPFPSKGGMVELIRSEAKSRMVGLSCYPTPSCTDALEMASALAMLKPGDAFMVPSYTFVTSASAAILRGARPIFLDSSFESPNIDVSVLDEYYTPDVKMLVVVHYAGISVDMDKVMDWAASRNVFVVEDAAHTWGAKYQNRKGEWVPPGTTGDAGAISFHHTKNIQCGEGGLFILNKNNEEALAEILWNKGTNAFDFQRGKVPAYEWVLPASSWQMSEMHAEALFEQWKDTQMVTEKRIELWARYAKNLQLTTEKNGWQMPILPSNCISNGHIFYLVLPSIAERDRFIQYLKWNGIDARFHYQALHQSIYFKDFYKGIPLTQAIKYAEGLVRLPIYFGMKEEEQFYVIEKIQKYQS